MLAVTNFLDRCVGSWLSDRRYIYLIPETKRTNMLVSLSVEKTSDSEPGYSISWNNYGESDNQTMDIVVGEDGNLYRSRGYATTQPTCSFTDLKDDNELVLKTEYQSNLGDRFVESIKFLGPEDLYRVRQTYAYKDNNLYLVGQYLERRVIS